MTINLKENPSFLYYRDVKSITNTFNIFGELQYFGFGRIFSNGQFFNLMSDPQWAEDHYIHQKQLPATALNYHLIKSGVYLPQYNEENNIGWRKGTISLIKEKYNITHPVLFIKKNQTFNETTLFAFKKPPPTEFYINHRDIFTNYICYFKDKAKDLIEIAQKNPIRLRHITRLHYVEENSFKPVPLHIQKYYLWYRDKEITISRREYHCLSLLAHGFKDKGISQKLNISSRTVESYISNLKIKFGVYSREILAEIYWENQI